MKTYKSKLGPITFEYFKDYTNPAYFIKIDNKALLLTIEEIKELKKIFNRMKFKK